MGKNADGSTQPQAPVEATPTTQAPVAPTPSAMFVDHHQMESVIKKINDNHAAQLKEHRKYTTGEKVVLSALGIATFGAGVAVGVRVSKPGKQIPTTSGTNSFEE